MPYKAVRWYGTCAKAELELASWRNVSFVDCVRRCDAYGPAWPDGRPRHPCVTVAYNFLFRRCELQRPCDGQFDRIGVKVGRCMRAWMLGNSWRFNTYMSGPAGRAAYFRQFPNQTEANARFCTFTKDATDESTRLGRKASRHQSAWEAAQRVREGFVQAHPNATICSAQPLVREAQRGHLVGSTARKAWVRRRAVEPRCHTTIALVRR